MSSHPLTAVVFVSYSLRSIDYSPKKLKEVALLLRGNIYDALFCLRFLNKRPIAKLLTKFLVSAYCDALAKHAWVKSLVVSECFVGRAEAKSKLRFSARGRITRYEHVKSNLSIKLGLM
ncbi:MAG: uL22m family ribosomal protein [Candidatus Hodgkinia cicadicola]